MPAEFEKMRKSIKRGILKDNPGMSDKEAERRSYAIATAQWKKSHGGKAPSSSTNILFEYSVPIYERAFEDGEFNIKGVAINETITSNNHKFLAEEISLAAETLKGAPLLVDHRNEIDAIKGRVTDAYFDEINKNVNFKAKVMDKQIQEMIQDHRINSVSVGAEVKSIEEAEDGSLIPRGIKFRELSLVAVPADPRATFSMALKEAFIKMGDDDEDIDYSEDEEEKIDEKISKEMGTNHDIELKGGTMTVTEQQTPAESAKMEESKIEVVAEIAKSEIKELPKQDMSEIMKKMESMEAEIKSLKEIKPSTKGLVEVEEERTPGRNIVEGRGSLRGGSFTLVRA